jgi:hypothetical protein
VSCAAKKELSCGLSSPSEQSPLGKAHCAIAGHHEVIEDADIDQPERVFERAREQLAGEDRRRGVELERALPIARAAWGSRSHGVGRAVPLVLR